MNLALALAAALLLALLLVTHKPGADMPATSPDLFAHPTTTTEGN